jgi:hypothetical protein
MDPLIWLRNSVVAELKRRSISEAQGRLALRKTNEEKNEKAGGAHDTRWFL